MAKTSPRPWTWTRKEVGRFIEAFISSQLMCPSRLQQGTMTVRFGQDERQGAGHVKDAIKLTIIKAGQKGGGGRQTMEGVLASRMGKDRKDKDVKKMV